MSHWAEIDAENIVVRVLVGDNNEPDEGESIIKSLGGRWIKTSYNEKIRKNFAGIGMYYDEKRDAFIPQKPPVGVWEFNEETCRWEIPSA